MAGIISFLVNAPDELRERVAEFRRMPKTTRIEALKLAGAAVFLICCLVGGFYSPNFF